MDKINFQNGRTGRTPVNATNLNQLQDNVDNGKVDKTGGTINGNLVVTGKITPKSIEITDSSPCIDFHYNNSEEDYTSRIIEESSGMLKCLKSFKVGEGLYDNNDNNLGNLIISRFQIARQVNFNIPFNVPFMMVLQEWTTINAGAVYVGMGGYTPTFIGGASGYTIGRSGSTYSINNTPGGSNSIEVLIIRLH